jgi:hypothetical protein
LGTALHGPDLAPLGIKESQPARRFDSKSKFTCPPPTALVRRRIGRLLYYRAYVYYENKPGRRSAAKLLSKDEARRIAASIAKLPELLQRKT